MKPCPWGHYAHPKGTRASRSSSGLLHAVESAPPAKMEALEWLLLTTVPVEDYAQVCERLELVCRALGASRSYIAPSRAAHAPRTIAWRMPATCRPAWRWILWLSGGFSISPIWDARCRISRLTYLLSFFSPHLIGKLHPMRR